MDHNEIVKKLKMYLDFSPDPYTPIFRNYSMIDIYKHVKYRTPEGESLTEMLKPIIEKNEEGWKKLLQGWILFQEEHSVSIKNS